MEQLEDRRLLACDATIAEAPHLAAGEDQTLTAETVSILADAGSTRGTAHNIGQLDASQSLRGTVGRYDRSDVIRFELATEAEVDIALTGMTADLDLFLHNAAGSRLASSDNSSARNELINGTLPAGVYYAVVDPYRWAFSGYQITFSAEALAPPTPDPPVAEPPVDETPVDETPPVDDPSAVNPPATSFPDVAYYGGSNEWNLNAIDVPEVWAGGYAGEGVTVAIVDTGIDLDHADLISNLWVNPGEIPGNGLDDDQNGFIDDVHGWDFAEGDSNPNDLNGHGTHVAGTIAADDNGFGATGVAPNATIMAVKVLGNSGSGSTFDVAAGIRYAAANGADVINLSLGGGFSSTIRSAIAYAESLGSLVVAAAGNESAGIPGFPARFSADFSNVISVGAHSSSNRIAGFSNDVGGSGSVQVDAPGVSVYSTYAGGRYGRLSGTSMASPHVAGVAALALSANPNLSPNVLRAALVEGADRSVIGSDGIGGINAAVTVALALGGQATPASSGISSFLSSAQSTRVRATGGAIVAMSDSDFVVADAIATDDDAVDATSVVDPIDSQGDSDRDRVSWLIAAANRTRVDTDSVAIDHREQTDRELEYEFDEFQQSVS